MESSPYTPGAGHRPPVLAGREDLLRAWRTGLNDVAATGRQRAPDLILTAPRGVGKTVTVLAFQDLSEEQGYEVVRLQAASGNAGLVESLVRRAIARAEDGSGPWARARRAFDRIGGVNVDVAGLGAGVTIRDQQRDPHQRPSPEDVAEALATLAREVQKDRPGGGLLIAVDELQSAATVDLTLLAAALHGLNTEHPTAAVMFAATGLPHTFQTLKDAGVTHADRLFKFRALPLLLSPDDARYAIVEPARLHQVAWEPEAADVIVHACAGYPAHLQVFADQTWLAAEGPDITRSDAERGIADAAALLEQETLGPRFDAMTGRDREFIAALALAGGRAQATELAVALGRSRGSLSQLRDKLITEGDVYVPARGELSLTVPVFGPYVLANYEQARNRGARRTLPLARLQDNLEQAHGVGSPAARLEIDSRLPDIES